MVTIGTDVQIVAKDLAACERERIDAPGRIQPHGWLLALSDDLTRLTHLSGNAPDWLGGVAAPCAVAALPGRAQALVQQIGRILRAHGGAATGPGVPAVAQLQPVGAEAARELLVHRSATGIVAEVRPDPGQEPAATKRYLGILEGLGDMLTRDEDTPLRQVLQHVADDVRRATGFDRAMVYRLAADGSGEVIAEAKHRDLEPFLGIRYPVSDIPSQARLLYLRNRAREISDTAALPVTISPA